MSIHPYRLKALTTPYPVGEPELFTPSGSPLGRTQSPRQKQQTRQTLGGSPQLNRNGGTPPLMIPSLQYNMGMLASSESLNMDEISDMAQQRSRLKMPLQLADSNRLVSSMSQTEFHQRHQHSDSHSLSVALLAYGPSPLNHGHSRSFSLSLLILRDRAESGGGLDFNQNLAQQHLGANSSHLLPRMKTIEMYRKNAKKLSDPAVLFQYAQYMLQTALLLEPSPGPSGLSDTLKLFASTTPPTPPKKLSDSRSTLSLSFDHSAAPTDPDLRESLLKEAQYYLKRLSDKAYVEAQYLLGDAYSSGAFGKVDNKEAFSLFLSAAKRGHTECAFRTAHCYEEGLGTGRDARKGVDFLKLAASKNHPAAMYKLGIYFFYGRMGISDNAVNKKLGIKWLERALNVATELTSAAPYELGKLFQTGYSDILIKDEKYALELFAQAAAFGHVKASAILGHHYELGNVIPADPNLSIHYYTKAALGGHAQSMLALCAWYMVGSTHLPKDEQEAFEWAKRAASCGHGKAQLVLANFLDKGIGCEQNSKEAQSWYVKAAHNGQDKALSRIVDKKKAAAILKKLKKSKNFVPSASTAELEAQEKDCVIM